ncbi:hypothetical protein GQ457_03G014590 [Hibiscus cannabinus]
MLGVGFYRIGCVEVVTRNIRRSWEGKVELVLDSHSRVVLNWVVNLVSRPQDWWETFLETGRVVRQIRNLRFCQVDPACNMLVTRLEWEGTIPRRCLRLGGELTGCSIQEQVGGLLAGLIKIFELRLDSPSGSNAKVYLGVIRNV